MARKWAAVEAAEHVCGAVCEELLGPQLLMQHPSVLNEDGAEAAYLAHRAEISTRRHHRAYRPGAFWAFDPDAAPYRADPASWRHPATDVTSSSQVELEPWIAAGISQRRAEHLAKVRFLAAARLLEEWEIERLASRGGDEAAAMREGLSMQPATEREDP
jgi:hypothetical protein